MISACGGTFDVGGPISSPYWNSRNYPFDTECTWILKAPFNHSVVLTIDQFNFETDKKCFYDYVQVFDGNGTDAAQLMPRTCGTKGFNKTLTSSDTIMKIRFRSDKTVNDKGFTASWKTVVQKWKRECSLLVQQIAHLVTLWYCLASRLIHRVTELISLITSCVILL